MLLKALRNPFLRTLCLEVDLKRAGIDIPLNKSLYFVRSLKQRFRTAFTIQKTILMLSLFTFKKASCRRLIPTFYAHCFHAMRMSLLVAYTNGVTTNDRNPNTEAKPANGGLYAPLVSKFNKIVEEAGMTNIICTESANLTILIALNCRSCIAETADDVVWGAGLAAAPREDVPAGGALPLFVRTVKTTIACCRLRASRFRLYTLQSTTEFSKNAIVISATSATKTTYNPVIFKKRALSCVVSDGTG